MIYCLLIGCDDKFEPKKPTDVPERGQVLMIYPWTGAKAAAEALETNKHRIKYGSKHTWENVWMVLYVADEKPKQGDFLDFVPYKNVLRLKDGSEAKSGL